MNKLALVSEVIMSKAVNYEQTGNFSNTIDFISCVLFVFSSKYNYYMTQIYSASSKHLCKIVNAIMSYLI